MVLSELHWVPSALAALCAIAIALVGVRNRRQYHRALGIAMSIFAVVGLAGYFFQGDFPFFELDFHTIHSWFGIAALLLSLYLYGKFAILKGKHNPFHCTLGYIAVFLSGTTLILGLFILAGLAPGAPEGLSPGGASIQVAASSTLPEVEAADFQGFQLTPISQQDNNAIQGTQHINRDSYRLEVTGLVTNPRNFTYGELLAFPAYSEVAYMPCVEGWGFTGKWTGLRVADLLDSAGLAPNAAYVMFYSSDGYSTGLPLEYLRGQNILVAYGLNDVTLPPERGFPFQVVAKSKYGYKWGKWVTRIVVGDEEQRGFWESNGYSNTANVGQLPYG